MAWASGAFTRTNGTNTGSTLWNSDKTDGTKITSSRHDTHDQDLADGINASVTKDGANTHATSAGTDTVTLTLTPAATAYSAGMVVTFKAGGTNTGAATLNISGLGAKAIEALGAAISANDITADDLVSVGYDGTAFQMISPVRSIDTGIASLVADTSPQLGGNLDLNGNTITGLVIGTNAQAQGAVLDDLNTLGVNSADSEFLVGTGAGALAWESGATARASLGLAIGTDVQAFDSDILKADTDDTLTAGFASTADADGTKSSGTYTPTTAGGNFKTATNGGAHTLAPQTEVSTIVIQYTNNGSAGAVTTSGWDAVTGDALTTTNGDDFMLYLTVVGAFQHLHVSALQ
jgi:hypothetical protein